MGLPLARLTHSQALRSAVHRLNVDGRARVPFLISSSLVRYLVRTHADTVVVLTINYADWGSDGVVILTRSAS